MSSNVNCSTNNFISKFTSGRIMLIWPNFRPIRERRRRLRYVRSVPVGFRREITPRGVRVAARRRRPSVPCVVESAPRRRDKVACCTTGACRPGWTCRACVLSRARFTTTVTLEYNIISAVTVRRRVFLSVSRCAHSRPRRPRIIARHHRCKRSTRDVRRQQSVPVRKFENNVHLIHTQVLYTAYTQRWLLRQTTARATENHVQ